MNSFDVHALAYVMHLIAQAKAGSLLSKAVGQGASVPDEDMVKRGDDALDMAQRFFSLYPLGRCEEFLSTAAQAWQAKHIDCSSMSQIFGRLEIDILSELNAKREAKFLKVSDDRTMLVDKPMLFGEVVAHAFPSSSQDITESGNCLAAECNTAAVFHLMRASEVALRVVAVDRCVSFANKPLDQQEWGTILGALEGKLRDLRLADGKKWLKPEFKEAQIQFYNDTIQELRAFNEAWRRYISHADPAAFYDHDDAASIYKHVAKFMQKLATRISEQKQMPEFWDTE